MHIHMRASSAVLVALLTACVNPAPCSRGSGTPTGDGCTYVWQCVGTGTLRVECTSGGCECSVTREGEAPSVREAPAHALLRTCDDPADSEVLRAADITCGWNLCGNLEGATCGDGGILPVPDVGAADAGSDAGAPDVGL